MSINDLEKNKFALDHSEVSVDITEASEGLDDIGSRDLNDLEESKFEDDGALRIVTAI